MASLMSDSNDDLLKVLPQRLGNHACEAKFLELIKTPSRDRMQPMAELSLLTANDRRKLVDDARKVQASIQEDDCYPLSIAIENKYDMSKMALRVIKRHCIDHDLSWDIKRCSDYSIYMKQKSPALLSQFCEHIVASDTKYKKL